MKTLNSNLCHNVFLSQSFTKNKLCDHKSFSKELLCVDDLTDELCLTYIPLIIYFTGIRPASFWASSNILDALELHIDNKFSTVSQT